MKPAHQIESAVAGTALTAVYFFTLRHFGIGYGGGILTLFMTAVAVAWLYALIRFSRKDGDHWVWFERRYHPYDMAQLLWPGAFGGLAFLAITVYMKEPGLRLPFFVGWLFPVIGIATFWGFWHDRRTPRS